MSPQLFVFNTYWSLFARLFTDLVKHKGFVVAVSPCKDLLQDLLYLDFNISCTFKGDFQE